MPTSKTPAKQRERLLADAQAMVDYWTDEHLVADTWVGAILSMMQRLIDLGLEDR